MSTESGSSSVVKEIKEIWYGNGNEDKCDVFVIPWKAVPISKYAAKELCVRTHRLQGRE